MQVIQGNQASLNRNTEVWERNTAALRQAGVTTLQELVKILKPSLGNNPKILAVSSADAAEMLTDLVISVIPIARSQRDVIVKQIIDSKDKLTFNKIKRFIVSNSRAEFKNKQLTDLVKRSLENLKANPFTSRISLDDHSLTANLFGASSYKNFAVFFRVANDKIERLLAIYESEALFLATDPKNISATTGIGIRVIEKIKRSTSIANQFEVPVETAVAIERSFKNKYLRDLVKISRAQIRKRLIKSGVNIPKEQITSDKLNQLIQAARKIFPEIYYFNQIITELKLQKPAQNALARLKAESFNDLRRYVPKELNGEPISAIDFLIKKGKVNNPKLIGKLKAHTKLEKISKNLNLNRILIDANIVSASQVAIMPIDEFKQRFRNEALPEELENVHRDAQGMITKVVSLGAYQTMKKQANHLDKLVYSDTTP